MADNLYSRYDVPAPRYTSYPTVPYWENKNISENNWKQIVKETFTTTNETEGISLYIHIPFCESLCTYCGCNTRITKNHAVEEPYVDALLTEWNMYLNVFGEKPIIKEIHLGGGTPTFLKSDNIKKLIDGILLKSLIAPGFEFSIEAHPNYTTEHQLKTLFETGFNRISFGIQDFDERVQKTINRIQTFETVLKITQQARTIGFNSINYDLIYGLPFQTMETVEKTIDKVNLLRPDRIAFYSYAHVPWVKPGQRSYSEKDLPTGEAKRNLYERGRNLFEQNGYKEIGLDHFALPGDSLNIASERGKLHRNFMGYTTNNSRLLIGLGVSSISDAWRGFAQNEKKLETYLEKIRSGHLPVFKGHNHSPEDLMVRNHITNIMCRMQTEWKAPDKIADKAVELLQPMINDELVLIFPGKLIVTDKGKPFLRNICMAFDKKLMEKLPETQIFSASI